MLSKIWTKIDLFLTLSGAGLDHGNRCPHPLLVPPGLKVRAVTAAETVLADEAMLIAEALADVALAIATADADNIRQQITINIEATMGKAMSGIGNDRGVVIAVVTTAMMTVAAATQQWWQRESNGGGGGGRGGDSDEDNAGYNNDGYDDNNDDNYGGGDNGSNGQQ